MESIELSDHPFTLLIDWLAFTLPDASVKEVCTVLGGDWIETESGFRGYPQSWVMNEGYGVGKLGTGAPRRLREVHVDLSGGIVSAWPFESMQGILRWIRGQQGQLTRIDCALDDRKGLVALETINAAILAGQVITRVRELENRGKIDLRQKCRSKGATLYFGSSQSQTRLRIYDKRLELQSKERPDWEHFGIRWELQFKDERAQACGQALASLDQSDWHEFLVSLLRSHVDFRDVAADDPDWVRCQAPLLPWWAELTEGFKKGQLVIEKQPRGLDDVKNWVSRSIAPMLAVLVEAPEAGEEWLRKAIAGGKTRWKDRHRRLMRPPASKKPYVLKPP